MDHTKGFTGVEEDESGAYFSCNADADLPGELASKVVFQASTRKILVNESSGFWACSYESDKVWMPYST